MDKKSKKTVWDWEVLLVIGGVGVVGSRCGNNNGNGGICSSCKNANGNGGRSSV